MFATRRSVLVLTVAIVGMLLSAAPAKAFWPKYSYRQRTVVRGGGAGVIGVPGVFVGPTLGLTSGVGTQAFFLGTGFPTVRQSFLLGDVGTQAFLLGSGFPTVRQSYLLGDSDTELAQAFLRQALQLSGATPQGFKAPGSTGTGTGTGTTTTTTDCTGLSDRLDKISTRLETLQTNLTSIEKKVDLIVTEITQRKMQEQQEQIFQGLMKPVLAAIAADRQKQNRDLAFLFRQLLISDSAKRDMTKVEQLLRDWEK